MSSRRLAGACTLLALTVTAANTWAASPSDGTECPGYTAIDSLPFHIDEPGLYRVTTNLSGPKGITVGSDDVTLDLNGFVLEGEGPANGVFVEDPFSNFVIRNGTLRNWSTGVQAIQADTSRLEGLRAFNCSSWGLLTGDDSNVQTCITIDCEFGISVGAASRVADCVVRGGAIGVTLGEGAALTRCITSGTSGFGLVTDDDAHLTNVVSRDNQGVGMALEPGAYVSRCVVAGNASDGIIGGAHGVIERVVVSDNGGVGIDVQESLGDGRTSIHSSVVSRNGSHGIRTTTATLIADCVTAENAGHGVTASDFCNIHHLLSVENTNFGAGLHLTDTDSLVHDVHSVGNQYGFLIEGGYNELIHNSALSNVIDFSLAPNNVFGPLASTPTSAGAFANIIQ